MIDAVDEFPNVYQIRTEIAVREQRNIQRLMDLAHSSCPEDNIFFKAWFNPEGYQTLWFNKPHMIQLSKEFPDVVFYVQITPCGETTSRLEVFEKGKCKSTN